MEPIFNLDNMDITLLVLAGVVIATTWAQYRFTQQANRKMQSNIPKPAEIQAARVALQREQGISAEEAQQFCAKLIFEKAERWVAWEDGAEEMLPALWDLFQRRSREIDQE